MGFGSGVGAGRSQDHLPGARSVARLADWANHQQYRRRFQVVKLAIVRLKRKRAQNCDETPCEEHRLENHTLGRAGGNHRMVVVRRHAER